MKRIMFIYYTIAIVVGIAVSVLMDVKNWKDYLKSLICAVMAASIVILAGQELLWSKEKIMLGIILLCCYARPIVYGINKLIKEFFKDPKTFIEKYRGLKR